MNYEGEETPQLTPDDRAILSDMMFPIFKEALDRAKHVARDEVRKNLVRFFPWPHIQEVMEELEEKEYISTISTRGGGLFGVGRAFEVWAREMAPIEYDDEKEAPADAEIKLSGPEIKALAGLLRSLAADPAEEKALASVRLALADAPDDAGLLKKLAGG